MKILDLFSGIGGFSLAGRWANMETVQFVEIDPFCRRVLEKNFQGVPIHDDIKSFRGERFRGVDLLTGGFPCQPYSVAGKRQGATDDRALWGEMLRVIQESEPSWIVGENVANLLNMGFDHMLYDLEKAGYETRTFVIPACAVNAPHKRDRLWVVANAPKNRRDISRTQSGTDKRDILRQEPEDGNPIRLHNNGGGSTPPNSESIKRERFKREGDTGGEPKEQVRGKFWVGEHWQNIEPCIRRGDNGVSRKLHTGKRTAALGNAIVPQVAYAILKAIQDVDS